MDFSQEDLFDAIDRLVAGLLERAGVTEPPVDALQIAEDHLGIPVELGSSANRPGRIGAMPSWSRALTRGADQHCTREQPDDGSVPLRRRSPAG